MRTGDPRHARLLLPALLLAVTAACLQLPAAVRDQARADAAPLNHFAATDSGPTPPAPGRWPPPRDGLFRRVAVPADVAWPPPFTPRAGQILASEQGSAQGLFLSLFPAEFHTFVHTALVAVEDGDTVVYETSGVLRAEIGGTPVSRAAGGVRRVRWDDFVREQRFVAVFDPPAGADMGAALAYARGAVGVPFDIRFDATDAGALYCTELTAQALAAAGTPRGRVPFTANTSLRVILDWLGIRGDDLYSPASIVADLAPVALISRWHSAGQARAYFAAKAELYRRFTNDQRLGNVIAYSPFRGLALRAPVQGFLAAVNAAAAGWPDALAVDDDALAARIRTLADQYLGAFPDEP